MVSALWLGALAGLMVPSPKVLAQGSSIESKWEAEIKAFEASDWTNLPPKNAFLFVGSSSVRLWKTLAQDFSGLTVINRGFGGSQIEDSIRFADRLILAYRPKMVLLYAGDNDLAAGKTPEQVFHDFQALARNIHAALPSTRLAFISIKPSPAREHLMESAKAANRLVRNYARNNQRLIFIDVFAPMLDPQGKPRPELFGPDRLHMNAQGYHLWAKIIRPYLK